MMSQLKKKKTKSQDMVSFPTWRQLTRMQKSATVTEPSTPGPESGTDEQRRKRSSQHTCGSKSGAGNKPRKRGRPCESESKSVTENVPKKRGRPRKNGSKLGTKNVPKNRGRPRKNGSKLGTENVAKKRGRPSITRLKLGTANVPRKQGRPRKQSSKSGSEHVPKKRGRPCEHVSKPESKNVPKKRGIPCKRLGLPHTVLSASKYQHVRQPNIILADCLKTPEIHTPKNEEWTRRKSSPKKKNKLRSTPALRGLQTLDKKKHLDQARKRVMSGDDLKKYIDSNQKPKKSAGKQRPNYTISALQEKLPKDKLLGMTIVNRLPTIRISHSGTHEFLFRCNKNCKISTSEPVKVGSPNEHRKRGRPCKRGPTKFSKNPDPTASKCHNVRKPGTVLIDCHTASERDTPENNEGTWQKNSPKNKEVKSKSRRGESCPEDDDDVGQSTTREIPGDPKPPYHLPPSRQPSSTHGVTLVNDFELSNPSRKSAKELNSKSDSGSPPKHCKRRNLQHSNEQNLKGIQTLRQRTKQPPITLESQSESEYFENSVHGKKSSARNKPHSTSVSRGTQLMDVKRIHSEGSSFRKRAVPVGDDLEKYIESHQKPKKSKADQNLKDYKTATQQMRPKSKPLTSTTKNFRLPINKLSRAGSRDTTLRSNKEPAISSTEPSKLGRLCNHKNRSGAGNKSGKRERSCKCGAKDTNFVLTTQDGIRNTKKDITTTANFKVPTSPISQGSEEPAARQRKSSEDEEPKIEKGRQHPERSLLNYSTSATPPSAKPLAVNTANLTSPILKFSRTHSHKNLAPTNAATTTENVDITVANSASRDRNSSDTNMKRQATDQDHQPIRSTSNINTIADQHSKDSVSTVHGTRLKTFGLHQSHTLTAANLTLPSIKISPLDPHETTFRSYEKHKLSTAAQDLTNPISAKQETTNSTAIFKVPTTRAPRKRRAFYKQEKKSVQDRVQRPNDASTTSATNEAEQITSGMRPHTPQVRDYKYKRAVANSLERKRDMPESEKLSESHKITQDGEKPHPCDLCEQRFHTKLHLKLHKILRHYEKPLVCKECKFYTADEGLLKKHLRSHKGG